MLLSEWTEEVLGTMNFLLDLYVYFDVTDG